MTAKRKQGSWWKAILWFILGVFVGLWLGSAGIALATNKIEPNGCIECVKPQPKPRLTYLCKAPEDGKANAYISGSEGFTPVEVEEGDYLFRVLNQGDADITSYEVKLASTLVYTGGAVPAGGWDFFTIDTAMAGLHIEAQPSGEHGTASTNETLCEMVEEEEPTPTPTPEPTPEPRQTTEAGPPSLPICEAPIYAPTITEVGRIDADTVYARWTEVADRVNTYYIWYGLSEDNLPWNTVVDGEYVELSGDELIGRHVWLNVRGVHEGCEGPQSLTIDP